MNLMINLMINLRMMKLTFIRLCFYNNNNNNHNKNKNNNNNNKNNSNKSLMYGQNRAIY